MLCPGIALPRHIDIEAGRHALEAAALLPPVQKSGGDTAIRRLPSRTRFSQIATMRSGSAYGKLRNRTAFTTEKTAVFAPILSASIITAASVESRILR